jgi:putative ubiquitin-RnfH superfamily antitoxin RatB of RatAB toxin-antitoxin module
MALGETSVRLRVSVAYSPKAGAIDEVTLWLEPGATVADALAQSGLPTRHPRLVLEAASIGIWGALCRPADLLRDRDRVEVYRPLMVDPKEARRLRYRGHRIASGKAAAK